MPLDTAMAINANTIIVNEMRVTRMDFKTLLRNRSIAFIFKLSIEQNYIFYSDFAE
jgi:hypothetical protein